jgi:hypothetical protein
MMIRRASAKRRGATAVELGVVSILLFMMLFGIFEYCRLLYLLHTANNAARDTVRFAVVHTSGGGAMPGEPLTISAADLDSIVRTGLTTGGFSAGSGMGGMANSIENLTVEIFAVDPVGLAQTPQVVQPVAGSTWNSAGFSQHIAVRISGNYRPVLPSLLFMGSTVPIQVTVMASSESN